MSIPRSDSARKAMLLDIIVSYTPKEHRKRMLSAYSVFGMSSMTRLLLDMIREDYKPWADWKIEDTQ